MGGARGDGGFLTPKAVAKRLKAKGLGRQWLYCQLCRKQCRDENGFKCHCTSEQHIRKFQLYEQNPEYYVEDFSKRFEEKFLEYVKRSHRSSFVPANVVYNQIIRERNHVRMNGTKWGTLSEFVEHLGREGKCKVEDTPKGLQVRYIGTDSEAEFKDGLKRKRMDAEAALEDRHEKEIEMQIQRVTELAKNEEKNSSGDAETSKQVPTLPPLPPQGDGKVAFALPKKKINNNTAQPALNVLSTAAGAGAAVANSKDAEYSSKNAASWLFEGIVVKVLARKLENGAYYKKKGVVKRLLESRRAGEIEMLDTGDLLRIDQAELETVIPQVGRMVRVVKGEYRGYQAKLLSCDTSKFCVTIQVVDEGGPLHEKVVAAVAYEDICKLL